MKNLPNISKLVWVNAFVYRSSNYNSYEEAKEKGGLYELAGCPLYGYATVTDTLLSCCSVANCIEQNSPERDIRIRMFIRLEGLGPVIEECSLAEATTVIDNLL